MINEVIADIKSTYIRIIKIIDAKVKSFIKAIIKKKFVVNLDVSSSMFLNKSDVLYWFINWYGLFKYLLKNEPLILIFISELSLLWKLTKKIM